MHVLEATRSTARIESVAVSAYTIPTDAPESDGTFTWDKTTMVLVELTAAGRTGIGYTYASAAAGTLIKDSLASVVMGKDPYDIPACWKELTGKVRNNGQTGLSMMAVAAVDNALWDLKAKLLDIPLALLLGRTRERVACYGSGGFTSYTDERLKEQLGGWAKEGFSMVKMKIGREPHRDPQRMAAAREAIGEKVELFVDANEAFTCSEALLMAQQFPGLGVTWYEQPVWHLDLSDMHALRRRCPPGVEISSGEYIFDTDLARRVIAANAVDVLQADATRCGISGFLEVAALCEVNRLPLSSHCAPSLHVALCCAAPAARHAEYFHDHVRIEHELFDGAATAHEGTLAPDLTRPGLGLEFRREAAQKYRVAL